MLNSCQISVGRERVGEGTCTRPATNHNTPGQTKWLTMIEISLAVVCLCPMTNCYLLELHKTKINNTLSDPLCTLGTPNTVYLKPLGSFVLWKGHTILLGLVTQKQKEWGTWPKVTVCVVHLYKILWLSSTLYKVTGRRILHFIKS